MKFLLLLSSLWASTIALNIVQSPDRFKSYLFSSPSHIKAHNDADIAVDGSAPIRPYATGKSRDTKDLLNREWDFNNSLQELRFRDVRKLLSRNDRFVPVIGGRKYLFFEKRQELFNSGVYPGVEYRIKDIILNKSDSESIICTSLSNMESVLFTEDTNQVPTNSSLTLVVRPAYPLIPQLERNWPVQISLDDIPYCLTRGSYNVLTVFVSISLAFSMLFIAWCVSQMITFSIVNTRSMSPTIQPRDIILVEKITPVVNRLLGFSVSTPGDVIFFHEPPKMRAYIERERLPRVGNALLVKRMVTIDEDELEGSCLEVRGDNAAVSLDSRQFGCVNPEYVVGKPLIRIFPLDRVGPLKSLNSYSSPHHDKVNE